MLKLICATKCSNNHMHPQIHSQDSLHFTLTLAILRGAALPHLQVRLVHSSKSTQQNLDRVNFLAPCRVVDHRSTTKNGGNTTHK